MTDIVVVKSDLIIYNSRARKIIRSLGKRYSISVLGWNREGFSTKSTNDNIIDLQLFNIKAPYGKPSLVPFIPLFWMWVLIKLFSYRPAAVHACDFDSVLPCYIYKLIFRKKLVFDVFDRYAPSKIPPKFKTLYSLINFFEELFSKEADVLVNVTKKIEETFQKKPKHSAIIMNCSEDHIIDSAKSKDDGRLTLVYTGAIIRNRGLERTAAAIKDLNDVELIIAGRVIDKEFLNQILEIHNIKYKGLLCPDDALSLEAHSDAMVILYDLQKPNNNFASPTKMFEAMMFGLPMITNVSHELIDEVNCGIIVEYNNVNQIKGAIVSLRDNIELRRTLGNNSRKAFLEKYNWTIMEQELYKIYGNLLEK